MKTKEKRAIIARTYKIDTTGFSKAWVNGFWEMSVKNGRLDAAGNVVGDPDPNDTSHRSASGRNSAIAGTLPTITSTDEWKCVAAALGAYPAEMRAQVRDALLASAADLVGQQVLDVFQRAWKYGGLDADSDDQANRAGAAHGDSYDDGREAQRIASRAASREQLATPSRAQTKRTK
jgi:hypothetical protein